MQPFKEAPLMTVEKLLELGFQQDEFGALFAANCKITFYPEISKGEDFEIDILLPSGHAIGMTDISLDDIAVNNE